MFDIILFSLYKNIICKLEGEGVTLTVVCGNWLCLSPLSTLTLSCPGMGRAIVKIGHSYLRPGSKEPCILVFEGV